jgi:hypothetical protein
MQIYAQVLNNPHAFKQQQNHFIVLNQIPLNFFKIF